MRRIAIALVHHPVRGQDGNIVTSAITNIDVHDLARSAKTFGAGDCFIVSPITAQRELVLRICAHWRDGSSGRRIPDRKAALELVRVVASIDDARAALGDCETWATCAREQSARERGPRASWEGAPLSMADARARIRAEGKPLLLLFGTAHGLADDVLDRAEAILKPIRAEQHAEYNHLSVRAAGAIFLDRLLGDR